MATIADLCNQRKQYQLFNKPPIRYNPPNPYPGSTQEQLNMRRKVEILKYNKNSTQGPQLTKAQKLSQMLTRTSNLTRLVCPNDKYIPVLSTASDIPGPPIYLVEDDNVPLYKYAQNTDVYGEQVTDDDDEWTLNTVSNQLILSAQDHTTFCNLIIRPIIKQPYTNFTLQTPVLFRLQGIGMPSSTNGSIIVPTITPTNNTTNNNSFLTTYNSKPIANNSGETTFLQNNSINCTLIPTTPLVTTPDALLTSSTNLEGEIVADTYTNIVPTTTSGNGTGAILSIVASGTTAVTGVTVTTAGTGYAVGDILTVDKDDIPGRATDLVFTLTADDITTYNYFCEAYVGLVKFSNILLNTSPGFVYDFKYNYIIDYKDENGVSITDTDILNNIQFELYINLDDSYAIQPQQNCNITTSVNSLPEKKILFFGSS